jgi:hypothetical protein
LADLFADALRTEKFPQWLTISSILKTVMLPLSTAYVTVIPEFQTHFGMATKAMFGGNLLATRGDLVGPGSYEDAINGLHVTGIRYPGGAGH